MKERQHDTHFHHAEHELPGSLPSSLHETTQRLENAVLQIQDSDTFRCYLDAQARFHRSSWGNVALILAQRPDATQVAGCGTWRQAGRVVCRGEKGLRIFVPMRRRGVREPADMIAPTEEGDAADEAHRSPLYFGVGTVFDISQTEGPPLPAIDVPVLAGVEGEEVFERLAAVASVEGLTISKAGDELTGMMGYYAPATRQIVVRRAAPLQMTKTLAHELAHHFVGTRLDTDEAETVAEAVAYVVCAHFGLDTGERSFPYVAVWSREPKTLKAAMARIQEVSARLIDGIEGVAKKQSMLPDGAPPAREARFLLASKPLST